MREHPQDVGPLVRFLDVVWNFVMYPVGEAIVHSVIEIGLTVVVGALGAAVLPEAIGFAAGLGAAIIVGAVASMGAISIERKIYGN